MSYKRWIIFAVFLFCFGLLLGLGTPAASFENIFKDFAGLGDFADMLAPLPQAAVFGLIFIRNISVLLISLAFSPLFCVVPSLALFANGWIIGLVSVSVLKQQSIGFLLAGLLPHGVFELPGLIMGEAVALSFGTTVVTALFRKEQRELLIPSLRQNLKFLGIAFSLLLVAAAIETWLTPLLLGQA
jgi:stage II sporulation protein M